MTAVRVHDAFSHYYLPQLQLREVTTNHLTYHIVRLPLDGKEMQPMDVDRIVSKIQKLALDVQIIPSSGSFPLLTDMRLGKNPDLAEKDIIRLLEAFLRLPLILARLERLDFAGCAVTLTSALFDVIKKVVLCTRCLSMLVLPDACEETEHSALAVDLQYFVSLNGYPELLKIGAVAAKDNDYNISTIDLSKDGSRDWAIGYAPSLGDDWPVIPSEDEIEGMPTMPEVAFGISATRALAHALGADCVTIVRLDLSGVCSGDPCAEIIAQVLEVNRTLTELSMNRNTIGTRGGLALIDSLHRSKNTTLTELNLNDNSLTDSVASRLLEIIIASTTNLSYIGLDQNCISPKLQSRLSEELMLSTQPARLRDIVPALYANNTNQTRVVVKDSQQPLNDTSVRVLLHALRENHQVVHIDLSNNDITDDAATFLCQIMEGPTPIKKLILQSNHFSDEGAQKILNAIPWTPLLEVCDLRFQTPNPVSQEIQSQMDLLVEMNRHPRDLRCDGFKLVTNDPSVTAIHVDRYDGKRRCTNDTILLIRNVLEQHNTTVDELYVGNNAGFVNERAIADIAMIAGRLRLIDLSALDLDESVFVERFVPVLKNNCSLTSLNLSKNNRMTDTALGAVIRMLRSKNDTLQEVVVDGCREVTEGARKELWFCTGLNRHSKSFKTLMLSVEASSDKSLNTILLKGAERFVEKGTSHHLKREFNDLSCQLLCHAMVGNDVVTTIDVTGNAFTDVGARSLGDLIRTNVTLTHLNVSYNMMTDEGLALLGKALQHNATITVFIFNGNRASPDTIRMLNNSMTTNVTTSTTTTLYGTLHSRSKPATMTAIEHAAHLEKLLEDAIFDDAMKDLKGRPASMAKLAASQ